ncbi:MAG: hypothetical protein QM775_05125 [Pirellulales bacterium]
MGPLFRNKTENVERTWELLILLTPRIVYDGENAAEGAMYRKDAVQMEAAKFHRMSPVGKAHLAGATTSIGLARLQPTAIVCWPSDSRGWPCTTIRSTATQSARCMRSARKKVRRWRKAWPWKR